MPTNKSNNKNSRFDIENTAQSWGEALFALATEADSDASQRDTTLALHRDLSDLALVLKAYASRLGVERLPPVSAVADDVADAVADDVLSDVTAAGMRIVEPMTVGQEEFALELDALHQRLDAMEKMLAALSVAPTTASVEPAPATPVVAEIPSWLLDTLRSHHERLEKLEAAVEALTQRVDNLERTRQRDVINIPEHLDPETAINLSPDDMRPEAWGSIGAARAALSRRIIVKHRDLTVTRQSVLNAVVGLASIPEAEQTDDNRAELAQQRERADRLEGIDLTRDVKLGEVAALDDLEAARLYDVDADWPVAGGAVE